MNPENLDKVTPPTILEAYANTETDIAMLTTFLQSLAHSELPPGLMESTVIRSINRAEVEREVLRKRYEEEGER